MLFPSSLSGAYTWVGGIEVLHVQLQRSVLKAEELRADCAVLEMFCRLLSAYSLMKL